MTDNIWIDITICVLCSVVGGLIVATLFEFNPYGSSKVRRAVLTTFWLIFLSVSPLVIIYFIWGWSATFWVAMAIGIVWVIFSSVIQQAKETEKKETK